MKRRTLTMLRCAVALASAGFGGLAGADAAHAQSFSEPTEIDNEFLPLTKFERCELRGVVDGTKERVVRRLLERTEPFPHDGGTVETVVIEDKAFEDGELVERTLDYFAQADDGTVHYFGEDVDEIEDGEVVGHGGSWRYGRETNTLGVAMPDDPQPGDTWRFEDVPGITIEEDTVLDRLKKKKFGKKVYRDVIKVREDLVIEGESEIKYYARGWGNVAEVPEDGKVVLVGCERADDDGEDGDDD